MAKISRGKKGDKTNKIGKKIPNWSKIEKNDENSPNQTNRPKWTNMFIYNENT